MAVGSGLSGQLGLAEESTVGTPVTVTRFYEYTSLKPKHSKMTKTSAGIRAGAKGHRERNRSLVGKSLGADVEMNVYSKGYGVLLKHMLGGSSIAQIGATPVWRQIHLAGDLTGKSLTVQGGFAESYSGTVRPYTYNGCKVDSWEMSCQADDLLRLKLTLDGWNWTTATALASASYLTSLEEFHWAQLTATIGGTLTTSAGRTTLAGATAVKGLRGFTLKGDNPLRTDRRLAGGAGVKSEQLENGWRNYTGDLDLEFADRTQFADLFDADTSTALQLTFTGVVDVGSANFAALRLTYPKVRFDDGSPDAGGPDIVDGKISFTALEDDAGTHPLIQFEYESVDTAI